MIRYLAHRLLVMIPTLLVISALVFVIIQLPEGDFLTSQIAELEAQGESVNQDRIEFLRREYGLDRPPVEQYVRWVGGMLVGDFGYSFEHRLPVNEVVGDRLFLTFLVSFATIVFTWLVSFPIGVYSATHQYSAGDHALTFLGFIGLATPNFLLALVLLYFANVHFGTSIGGLMDPEYLGQPMSWGKLVSVLEHLWIPVVVIGTSGTAGMIRRLRANLLDELRKQYVVTARAKGMPRLRLLLKYPLRMALNPFVADIGNLLPAGGLRGRGRVVWCCRSPTYRADADRSAPEPGHVPRGLVPHVPRRAHRRRDVPLRRGARLSRPPASASRAEGDERRGAGRHGSAQGGGAEHLRLSAEPFDPYSIEALSSEQERYYLASQWRMMWWRLKRHRLAVVSGLILAMLYLVVVFAEIIAPYGVHSRNVEYVYAPAADGALDSGRGARRTLRPRLRRDPRSRASRAGLHPRTSRGPCRFASFCRGEPYRMWGVIPARFHLVCPAKGGVMFLLGTDRLGRDVLSRVVHGARISLTIGLIGISISFLIGLTLGGARRLPRRLDRRPGTATHRDHPFVSRSCRCGWPSLPPCR